VLELLAEAAAISLAGGMLIVRRFHSESNNPGVPRAQNSIGIQYRIQAW
jgi:hypothetical protein